MDLSNADHRTRRTLIRPELEHGDFLGLTGLPVGQKQRTIPGPHVWASLIFLLSVCFWGSPDLILRLCSSTVPTCGCCRKRRVHLPGGSTGRSDPPQYPANLRKKGRKWITAKDEEGRSASVAHFIFLNECRLSKITMLIQQALADCLDSSRPPHPIFGLPGEMITLFCPQLSLAPGKCHWQ
jgi:hypothetical protein